MSIRILNHNGTAHQLSASMITAFQSELRRIGEFSSPHTVNLWLSNQTPEELLEILKRIPDRPTDYNGSGGDKVWVPPSPEIPKPEDGNEGSATALVSTDHHDGAVTGRQHGHDTRGGRLVEIPYNPKRVYNSFYQRETGHIFADPFGTGELENRGGVIVNLRDEREREEDRMERKGRDGVNGGGAIRRVR